MSPEHNSFYIDGGWVPPATGARIQLVNASTEEPIGAVPEGQPVDIDRAVAAARRAFENSEWSRYTPTERGAALSRFADAMDRRGDALARAVSLQNGMPIGVAQQMEHGYSVAILRYYAALAADLKDEENRPSPLGMNTVVRKQPVGVVGAIVPWNFPVVLAMTKIAPALAAGCTLVLKPSPGTVLDSYLVAEAAHEAGLPAGVLNWVAGDRELGAYLVSHPGVDKVAFTGSTGAGRQVAQACGQLLRPVSLELGGKSAAIVLEDADLDMLASGLPSSSLLNNGQACFSCTRILAPASRYNQVVEAVAAAVKALAVGDALDPSTQIGPMASALHRDRVVGFIERGQSEGRLVAGGERAQPGRGWFVPPTVFADVGNESTIAREEIFGPVLCVIRYADEEDALRIANASEYGLGGVVWSTDRDRALRLARRMATGTVGINGYMPDLNAPFGGVKSSGLGREMGPEALSGYQTYKSVYLMG